METKDNNKVTIQIIFANKLLQFGRMLVAGSSVDVNLLMAKVCRGELGYNETVCDNLNLEEYDDFETEGL